MNEKNKEKLRELYKERDKYIESLKGETDRGICLIAASYFEYQLGIIIENKLVKGGKDKKKLFDFNGPLGTFSSRIEMAFYLGLIGKEAKRDLHLIRKIRNKFAHNYSALSFEDSPIKELCNEFYYNYLDKQSGNRSGNFLAAVSGIFTIIILENGHIEHIEEVKDMEFSDEMKKYVNHLKAKKESE